MIFYKCITIPLPYITEYYLNNTITIIYIYNMYIFVYYTMQYALNKTF